MKMCKDGELHAEEDRKGKEELETRNEAENAVYRTERPLKDNRESISEANRGKIESALHAVKEALKGSPAAAIRTASATLNETWQAVSADLYRAASAEARAGQGHTRGQPGPQPPPAGSAAEGGNPAEEVPIIDAEIVDDQKAA